MSSDRIYRERATARRWERHRDPQDAPDPDEAEMTTIVEVEPGWFAIADDEGSVI